MAVLLLQIEFETVVEIVVVFEVELSNVGLTVNSLMVFHSTTVVSTTLTPFVGFVIVVDVVSMWNATFVGWLKAPGP
jgi:hypothetical protein